MATLAELTLARDNTASLFYPMRPYCRHKPRLLHLDRP